MKSLRLLLFVLASTPALAQPAFVRGEVIVVSATQDGFAFDSTVSLYGNDGAFDRTLVETPGRLLTDAFATDGLLYVGARSPHRIERLTAAGTFLAPFTTNVVNVNFLSPGPNGGLLAMNVSGEIYHFAADGTLVYYRDITADPPGSGGIDLASDQCTVIFTAAGALVAWNACTNTPATLLTPSLPDTYPRAIRILPDGTFLLSAVRTGGTVLHLSSTGSIIREYPIPGAVALALDPDGTSFWTNAANYLLRVDIATGTVLSETFNNELIFGITVVGEPRAGIDAPAAAAAPIPTLSPLVLLMLAMSLGLVALQVLRR